MELNFGLTTARHSTDTETVGSLASANVGASAKGGAKGTETVGSLAMADLSGDKTDSFGSKDIMGSEPDFESSLPDASWASLSLPSDGAQAPGGEGNFSAVSAEASSSGMLNADGSFSAYDGASGATGTPAAAGAGGEAGASAGSAGGDGGGFSAS